MSKSGSNDREKKKFTVETLQFLIRQRNIALFRLNAIRNEHRIYGDLGAELEEAKSVVANIRRRFILEVDNNQHLLSEAEKQIFFKDNRRKQ